MQRRHPPSHRPASTRRDCLRVAFAAALALLASGLFDPARALDPLLERERWRLFKDEGDLPSLYINDIAITTDNVLWIATDRGLVRHNGRFYTEASIEGMPISTRFNCVLYAVDGTVWAGTSAGIVRYVGSRWNYVRRTGNVTSIAESADGAIWAAVSPDYGEDRASVAVSASAGIHRYKQGEWTHFGANDGLPMDRVQTMFADDRARVVVVYGSETRTEAIYQFANGRWQDIAGRIGLDGIAVLSIAQTSDGSYWFGTQGRGVWRWHKGKVQPSNQAGISTFSASSLLPMPDGTLWAVGSPVGTIWAHRHGEWTSYPIRDVGIAGRRIVRMLYGLDDTFWFAIPGRGIARFSRRGGPWWTYDQRHDLPSSGSVSTIRPGVGETMWIGTTAGLLKYDGSRFTHPAAVPFLSDAPISAILPWQNGDVWVASSSPRAIPGIWNYDGARWYQVGTTPVLDREAAITAIYRARNGNVWVSTVSREDADGYGVFRLAGTRWFQYTVDDGLPDNRTLAITEDSQGNIWVGTSTGLARFDGSAWQGFTQDDGIGVPFGGTVLGASDGSVWAGATTSHAGVCRYKDGEWETFTIEEGLSSDDVWSIIEAEDGSIWFGTAQGASRFDGYNWLRFNSENGLAKDQIWGATVGNDGSLWFGHFDGAISKYRPIDTQQPQTFLEPLPERIAHPGFVTIRWQAQDPWDRTRTKDLRYTWRIDGGPWAPYSTATSVTFETLPGGPHLFEVESIDQEMNLDQFGARAIITVDPPFWLAPWFLAPSVIAVAAIGIFGGIAWSRNIKYRRAQRQLMGELQRELQVAQKLQAGLLPQADPVVKGLSVTGLCIPASAVGGDYFTYLWQDHQSRRLGVVVADVTGHAMQAAIPAVLFSGMLATASRETTSPAEILETLNDSLFERTNSHTFICCTVAVFDLDERKLYLANAGGLDPIRLSQQGAESVEIEGDRLPLGIVGGMQYGEHEIPLHENETYVFLTDGLVEAKSQEGDMFGFDRVLTALEDHLEVDDVREHLVETVTRHAGGREFDDDITLLVVRIEPALEAADIEAGVH